MSSVVQSSKPSVTNVLIPGMNFTCNGTITGFTFAGRLESGSQNPMIQIWRQNHSQPGVYYRTGADIVINEVLCEGGFTQVSGEVFAGVFRCNLIENARRTVRPGDVLGLELAPQSNDAIDLSFARVIKGPTNYVFSEEPLVSSPSIVLSGSDSVNRDLPQITFKVSGMLLS